MTVLSNLANLLQAFGALRGSRILVTESGLILFDGGTDSAYENYALPIPGKITRNMGGVRSAIAEGLDFFSQTGRPHIWPLFPGLPEVFADELASRGAVRGDVFFGMSLALVGGEPSEAADKALDAFDVREMNEGEAEKWADATWRAFDSDDGPPESFVRFVSEALQRKEISLVAAEPRDSSGSLAASAERRSFPATGMLFASDGVAGLYYIATLPEMRNRGLGRLIVEKLLDMGRFLGCGHSCLLATPQGRPLYRRCGFKEEHEVPIHVFGEIS